MTAAGGVLLPTLTTSVGYLVRRAQQVHTALWSHEIPSSTTSVQFAVLLAVGQHPGLDQRGIGRRVSVDKVSTAAVVAGLERRGVLARRRDPADARRYIVELTPAGATLLAELGPAVLRVQSLLTAPLTGPEVSSLVAWLQKVARCEAPASTDVIAPYRLGARASLDLLSEPGHLIRRAQQVHTDLWRQAVGTELTSPQYSVLLTLLGTGEADQRTVGDLVFLDKSTAAEILSRLARRSYLRRRRDSVDTRRNLVRLTAQGEDAVTRLAPAVRKVQRMLLAPVPASERRTGMALLRRVGENADER